MRTLNNVDHRRSSVGKEYGLLLVGSMFRMPAEAEVVFF